MTLQTTVDAWAGRPRGLRLITCDGFDNSSHAYLENVVAFAMLVTVRKTTLAPTD